MSAKMNNCCIWNETVEWLSKSRASHGSRPPQQYTHIYFMINNTISCEEVNKYRLFNYT